MNDLRLHYNLEEYIDFNDSYFNQYGDKKVYEAILDFKKKSEKIIKQTLISTKEIEPYINKFLNDNYIINLNTIHNRYKLERIFIQYPIPQINKSTILPENIFLDIRISLIIEKFYKKTKNDKDEISINNEFNVNNNFPNNIQAPIFNPNEYPKLLQLYTYFLDKSYDYKQLHILSGNYYDRLNKKLISPILILSSLSSIVSFIASSKIIKDYYKVILAIIVGSMSTLSTMFQSFNSAYQFDLKANSHYKAADDYDGLIAAIDFEKNYPINSDFFQKLEEKLLLIKNNNPFLVPNFIKTNYYKDKDKAGYLDFVKSKIIKPMEDTLQNTIINGDLDSYKYYGKNDKIMNELLNLQKLKNTLEDTYNNNRDFYVKNKNKNKNKKCLFSDCIENIV